MNRILTFLTALLILAVPATSSAVAYIKIEGIDGESTDSAPVPTTTRFVAPPADVKPDPGPVEFEIKDGTDGQREPVACTADAKICPDGTAVGRDHNNNCEFFPCPLVPSVAAPKPTPGALPELPPFDEPCDEGYIECPDGTCVRDREECPQPEPTALPVPLPIKEAGDEVPPADKEHKGWIDIEAISDEGEHKEWIDVESISDEGDPDRPIIVGDVPNPAAKKPKEIVVVGSKVQDETEKERDARVEKATAVLQQPITSAEQLPNYLQAIADSDENVEELSLKDDVVTLSYKQPAKLFGFIPVQYTMTTAVEVRGWDPVKKDAESDGRIKVQLPWWILFASDNADQVVADMEEILANTSDEPLQKMQQTLQTMSNVSKMHHDTAMAVIRKIGG